MKKTIMLAKQGVSVKLLQLLIQFMFLVPLFFLVSILVTSTFSDYPIISQHDKAIRIVVFTVLNLIILLRNSLIVVKNNQLIIKDIGGGKQKINIECIHNVEIITSKQLRKIILNRTSIDPLTTNCISFIVPIGNSILFQDDFNRDIIISVWNIKKLYDLLKMHEVDQPNNTYKTTREINSGKINIFKIKTNLKNNIKIYLKNWNSTIIMPIVYLIVLFVVLRLVKINLLISYFASLFLFFLISLSKYNNLLKVIVKQNNNHVTIKMNCYNNTQFGTLNIRTIKNLRFINSYDEIVEILTYQKLIKTPINYIRPNQIISFEADNGYTVLIQVEQTQELFNILNEFSVLDS